MGRDIPVTLLKALVLPLIVQIIAANNNSPRHLGRNDDASKHATAHRHIPSERTFLVNVGSVNGLTRGLENRFHKSGEPKSVRTLPSQIHKS